MDNWDRFMVGVIGFTFIYLFIHVVVFVVRSRVFVGM